ncbi:MAG: SCO family protein [Spirochaetia bacterium]|nr:SCO family protein [Spirochaetia bacterium]
MRIALTLIAVLCACAPMACHKPVSSKIPLPFYLDKDLGPHWIQPGSGEWSNIHTIPAFQLVDQNGKSFSAKNLDGKVTVAHFFFTRCAGICPKTIRNLKKVASDFQNDDGILFVSHSVTPEIDSPEILRAYAAEHSLPAAHWRLLTGERKQIYRLAREDYFADEDLGKTGPRGDDFLHCENIYLLDGKRRIRGLYKGTFEPEMARLAEDIATLKKESPR